MRILFDFFTLHSKNGAAEYTRSVFEALVKRIELEHLREVQVFCLYDSRAIPLYPELCPDNLKLSFVRFVDIQNGVSCINELDLDVFFFGCAQNGSWHPEISEIACKSIIVFHDCVWEELYNNDISIYLTLNNEDIFRYRARKGIGRKIYFDIKGASFRFCRWLLYTREHGLLEKGWNMVQPSLSLFWKRDDNCIVTVSNYSRGSLIYNFNIPLERIHVKYSPERIYKKFSLLEKNQCNEKLKQIIDNKIRYYLIVSAGRDSKNAKKALMAFHSFSKLKPDVYMVTVGYKRELFANHIDLDFLSDNDLEKAYNNCYALLYPSVFEGFGYPPLEAMKYAKPVLASNVCSMPEILGDAPIYFSPFYESAIFNALTTLDDFNYSVYSEKSIKNYQRIQKTQEHDLSELIDMLLNINHN